MMHGHMNVKLVKHTFHYLQDWPEVKITCSFTLHIQYYNTQNAYILSLVIGITSSNLYLMM